MKAQSWEYVDKDSLTSRLRVPGGWLYYHAVAMVFVPIIHPLDDPDYFGR